MRKVIVLIAAASIALAAGGEAKKFMDISSTKYAGCVGISGYAGMSADYSTVLMCTSDGTMWQFSAR